MAPPLLPAKIGDKTWPEQGHMSRTIRAETIGQTPIGLATFGNRRLGVENPVEGSGSFSSPGIMMMAMASPPTPRDIEESEGEEHCKREDVHGPRAGAYLSALDGEVAVYGERRLRKALVDLIDGQSTGLAGRGGDTHLRPQGVPTGLGGQPTLKDMESLLPVVHQS